VVYRYGYKLIEPSVRRGAMRASIENCMQRFKPGDHILILPKFAHLYPGNAAVVIQAESDPFRAMFNDYMVQFADGSSAHVFEFQIIDDLPKYTTLIAVLAYDSHHPTAGKEHGPKPHRQLLLQTPPFDLDIKILAGKSTASIVGQVLERRTSHVLKPVEVSLMNEGSPLERITSDKAGLFTFSGVRRGPTNILAVIPKHLARILGEISI
jgi:hypothetical protein